MPVTRHQRRLPASRQRDEWPPLISPSCVSGVVRRCEMVAPAGGQGIVMFASSKKYRKPTGQFEKEGGVANCGGLPMSGGAMKRSASSRSFGLPCGAVRKQSTPVSPKLVQLGGVAVSQCSGSLPSVRANMRTLAIGVGLPSFFRYKKSRGWTAVTSTVFVLIKTFHKSSALI
jgi:hypothetical protein